MPYIMRSNLVSKKLSIKVKKKKEKNIFLTFFILRIFILRIL